MGRERSTDPGGSDRWDMIEELLERALALDDGARQQFLADLATRDGALHRELLSLLHGVDDATRYFDQLGHVVSEAMRDMDAMLPNRADTAADSGRFRLEDVLGQGGMGIVYRAFDTVLQRTVALKFLSPGFHTDSRAADRLIAEARAAAALDHPNVCTIHEAGTTADGRVFLAMPCYDGETLSRRLERASLSIDEVLDLGSQMAAGLAAAHAVGLVHRDVKPGNVLITSAGVVKLLDFGLAHRRHEAGAWSGIAPGTAAYMSPEQLEGRAVDARADLWALGVVLYEMITGRHPFAAADVAATTQAVLHDAVAPLTSAQPGVPKPLAALVMRLLERDRDLRPASAGEVVAELAGIRAAPARRAARIGAGAVLLLLLTAAWGMWTGATRNDDIRTIAVLPLVNINGDPRNEHFSVALHEQLIGQLGRIETLKVIHRESVLQYSAAEDDIVQAAADLGVDGVMIGTVRTMEDSVHLSLTLVRAGSGRTVWTETFQTSLGDVLSIHDEATRHLARALDAAVAFSRGRLPATQQPRDPAARESWFRGLYHHSQDMATLQPGGADSTILLAIASFEDAVRREPDWSDAHAYLASAYHMYAGRSRQSRSEALQKSRAAALRALTLDPTNAHAYGALGFVSMSTLDWDGAERALRRALELNPNTPYVWTWALYLQLAGRHDEAIAAFHRAEELNPTYERLKLQIANAYACAERHEDAIAHWEELLRRTEHRIPPAQWATWRSYIARSYSSLGQHDRALMELERAVERVGTMEDYLVFLALINARAGRTREARAFLEQIESRPGLALAAPEVYAALGDTATAVRNVEFLYETRAQFPLIFPCSEGHRALRHQPRIQELLRSTLPSS